MCTVCIFTEVPLNHWKICSIVSAMAVTALQNKEGLIISDGNSRINNRGLARRSRRGRRASAAEEEGEREREREVVRGSRGGDEGKGAGVVGG